MSENKLFGMEQAKEDKQKNEFHEPINRPRVRGQHIPVPWTDFYPIQQVLLEFCDYYDAKSSGHLTEEEFHAVNMDYLTDDCRFEWPNFPRPGKMWHYEGKQTLWNKWFKGMLFNFQKDAWHQPGPIQIIEYDGTHALVRQRIMYHYWMVKGGAFNEASENVVWRLRKEKGVWKICLLQNEVKHIVREQKAKL